MAEPAVSSTPSSGGGLAKREQFSARWVFILAAIGSAVGLGNIWRFPYIAYENGGGAFIIPYLVALLTAGIPLLFFDHAIGHRFRGSPPLAFRRLHKGTEVIGWFQVMVCVIIGIYYAAIVGWAIMYTWFSVSERWGADPNAFFFGEYLQMPDNVSPSLEIVPGVFWPMLVVWLVMLVVLGVGVRRGIAMASMIGIPVLVLMFLVLVGVSLTLPGAISGLDSLFSPNWEALLDPGVWIAAYGQIFFSLSIGFGIMITYASYLKRRTNLTGSGLVVGFSNSGFEVLAGIGVFSALGFMAQASGIGVTDVVESGIGLAFVAFPALISEAGALGPLIGVLFFASLVLAGFTSQVSIMEVVVSAVKDKTGLSRWTVVGTVGVACAVVSLLLLGTTTGLPMLDTADAFVNNVGIVGGALVSVVLVAWVVRRLGGLVDHVNAVSSFRLGPIYKTLIAVVMPVVLGYMMIAYVIERIQEGYGGYPEWYVNTFGWGMMALLVVVAVGATLVPWSKQSALDREPSSNLVDHDDAEDETLSTGGQR